jgi:hypothetical protein
METDLPHNNTNNNNNQMHSQLCAKPQKPVSQALWGFTLLAMPSCSVAGENAISEKCNKSSWPVDAQKKDRVETIKKTPARGIEFNIK